MSTIQPVPSPRRRGVQSASLVLALCVLAGCSGLLQNLGARWVTRQISAELNLDDAQTEATRGAVDRLIAAAPSALGSKVDMLVASVDTALAKGLTEERLRGMERQIDKIVDVVARAIIEEASPILATLRDDQLDFAEKKINARLDEAREALEEPPEDRLEKRQDGFVKGVEEWAGELTDAQVVALRTYASGFPDESAARLRADEARLERIGDVLRSHPGSDAIRDALWTEWKDRENWGPGARSPEERRADGRKALLYVDSLMTRAQKDHASKHLHELHDRIKSFLGVAGS